MERLLYFLRDSIDVILFIALVVFVIKLIYWFGLYHHTHRSADYLENIDKNFAEHHKELKQQNEQIIENQKQIIELLKQNNKF